MSAFDPKRTLAYKLRAAQPRRHPVHFAMLILASAAVLGESSATKSARHACDVERVQVIHPVPGATQLVSAAIHGETCASAVFTLTVTDEGARRTIHSFEIPLRDLYYSMLPESATKADLEAEARAEAERVVAYRVTTVPVELRAASPLVEGYPTGDSSCYLADPILGSRQLLGSASELIVQQDSGFSETYLAFDSAKGAYVEIGWCSNP